MSRTIEEIFKENKNRIYAAAAAGSVMTGALVSCGPTEEKEAPEANPSTSTSTEANPSDGGGEAVKSEAPDNGGNEDDVVVDDGKEDDQSVPKEGTRPDDLPNNLGNPEKWDTENECRVEQAPVDEAPELNDEATEPWEKAGPEDDAEPWEQPEYGPDVQIDHDTGLPIEENNDYPDGIDRSSFEPAFDISTPAGGTHDKEGNPTSLTWDAQAAVDCLGLDPNIDIVYIENDDPSFRDGSIIIKAVLTDYAYEKYKSGMANDGLRKGFNEMNDVDQRWVLSSINPRDTDELEKAIDYWIKNPSPVEENPYADVWG